MQPAPLAVSRATAIWGLGFGIMFEPLGPIDVLLRLAAAIAAGFIVGLERESRGRAAGLRTTILVCTASALAMIVAFTFYTDVGRALGGQSWRPDPNRVAQGILAGMGFLGVGTILRHGTVVRGLTTAAGLWFVTILGIAFGSGYYLLGAAGVGIAILTLLALPVIERRVHNDRYAILSITLGMDSIAPDALRTQIEGMGAKVLRVDLDYNLVQKQRTVRYELRYRKADPLEFPHVVIDALLKQQGVQLVKWDLES